MEHLANTIYALLMLSLMGTGFSLIERLAPLQPSQPVFRKDMWIDLAYLLLNLLLFVPLLTVVLAPFVFLFDLWTPAGFRALVAEQPLWLQFVEVMVLADMGVYAGHRLLHRVPFLWKFHAIHHSATQVDWMTAFRSHPIDHLVLRLFMLVPLAPFAFTGSVLGWFALYYALQSAFLHANLRVSLGRFRGLYATPDFHRWHHSDFPEARDRNFVSIFPWIDRLFGTEFRATESARSFGTDAAAPSCITQIAYCLVPRQRVSGRAKA